MASTIKSGSNNDLYIQTDGVDRIVVDSNGNTSVTGNVGINTTNQLSYYAKDLVVNAVNEGGITIVGGTSDAQYIMFADGTAGADRYRGYIEYSHAQNYMNFTTNGDYRVRIDANGIVTKPYQPSFEAITNTAGTMSSGTKEFSNSTAFNGHVFTIIAHNIGSHYNSANSRFTAPVTGLYEIYGGMASHGANATTAYQSFEFYINGVRKWDGWNNKGTGYQKERTRRTFLLTAGDYVTPGYESAEVMTLLVGTTSSPYVHFGGYLIG